MDCTLVEKENLVERYLLGELGEEERNTFEEHFFECERCFGELETLTAIQAELADTAEDAQTEVSTRGPRTGWFFATGLAAAFVVIGIGLRFFLQPTQVAPKLLELARIDPPTYEAVHLRGIADAAQQRFRTAMGFYSAGDYAAALPGLEEASRLDPNAPNISFYLGAVYLLTGQTSKSIVRLQTTVDLGDTPYLEEALFLMAKAYLRLGDRLSAKNALQRAIALEGDWESESRALLHQIETGLQGARKGD